MNECCLEPNIIQLNAKLQHYQNLKNKYKIINRILNGVNCTITTATATTICVMGICTSNGIAIPIIVFGLLAVYIIKVGVVQNKKKKYSKKCYKLQEFISKLSKFDNNVRQDETITLEEIVK
jgi:hypothetical protein